MAPLPPEVRERIVFDFRRDANARAFNSFFVSVVPILRRDHLIALVLLREDGGTDRVSPQTLSNMVAGAAPGTVRFDPSTGTLSVGDTPIRAEEDEFTAMGVLGGVFPGGRVWLRMDEVPVEAFDALLVPGAKLSRAGIIWYEDYVTCTPDARLLLVADPAAWFQFARAYVRGGRGALEAILETEE